LKIDECDFEEDEVKEKRWRMENKINCCWLTI